MRVLRAWSGLACLANAEGAAAARGLPPAPDERRRREPAENDPGATGGDGRSPRPVANPRPRAWSVGLPTLLTIVLALAGCTTTPGDKQATATATRALTPPVATAAPPAGGTRGSPAAGQPATSAPVTPVALDPATSHLVGDSLCQARVPEDWVEDSPGSGTTGGGNVFAVFGGRLPDEATWRDAANRFQTAAAASPGATVTEGDRFVHVVYAADQGFAHRARFADRYCDLRVTARGGPIDPAERATWNAIVQSLAPAPPATPATGG